MKKMILVAIAALALTTSCEHRKPREYAAKLQKENNQLITSLAKKNGEISRFKSQLKEVHGSLKSIKEQEQLLSQSMLSDGLASSQTMIKDIEELGELLRHNRKKIEKLEKNLVKKDDEIDGLEFSIDLLKEQLDDRVSQLLALTEVLEMQEDSIANLTEVQFALRQQITKMEDLSNEVYIAMGTYKQLKKKNIVERGGLLGIAGKKQLTSEFDAAYFIEADRRTLDEIPLGIKKASLASIHPASSYQFVGNERVESLKILDPVAFWSKSDYLAIVTQ